MLLKVEVTKRRIVYADCIEDTVPNKGGYFVTLYQDYEKEFPVSNGEFILPKELFRETRTTEKIVRAIKDKIQTRNL